MSPSASSGSSTLDPTFVVGADLVEFDRSDLPIYATRESHWGGAGLDVAAYGAPLDRLFGEPGDVHVDGPVGSGQLAGADLMMSAPIDDPLVVLGGLSDGLILPTADLSAQAGPLDDGRGTALASNAAPTAEIATIFDLGSDARTVAHLHDGWSWESAGGEWTFDHGA